MKLKKIVSLALAGVLAVSMLAGCGTGSSSSTTTEQKPADTLTDSVIAKLSEDTTKKVTFTYDAGLKADAEKIVAYYGVKNQGDLKDADSATVLKEIGLKADDIDVLSYDSKGDKAKKDSEEQTTVQFLFLETGDANFAANKIAAKVEGVTIANPSATLKTLVSTGEPLKAGDSSTVNDCHYTFNYTGKMAVIAVNDEYGYVTGYAVVFSVTRTSSKVDL